MNRVETSPTQTLKDTRRRSDVAFKRYAVGIADLEHRLDLAMKGNLLSHQVNHMSMPQERKQFAFGTAWLPGPLSYPWLLMVAGLPEVVRNLTGLV